jgi:uncharacterized protein (DUF1800 family)
MTGAISGTGGVWPGTTEQSTIEEQTQMIDRTEPAGAWPAYTPNDRAPWNLQRVVHLHRRAGFAATWAEIERDLRAGPRASIDRVLAGRAATSSVPADYQRTAELLAESAATSGNPARLKAAWIYRMLFGPDPLSERLVLLWHNHFATSNLKVGDLATMKRQNDHFRRLIRAPFGELLNCAVREPALLLYLDAPANRRGHANENLARELMELFSLGIGHYTENDVREAARALTGWTVTDDHFAESPRRHDDGAKTILGRTGRWNGADLVRMLVEHPATAERLAFRLCEWLMGEGTVSQAALRALAEGLRRHDLNIGWGVETVLRSQAFFAEANIRTRVLSPVEFVVGAARALELFEPPASTLLLADWCARLGQDLFYPPNVGGWPGGRSWLTTRSLLGRANFAASLRVPERHSDDPVAFYLKLLLGVEPTAAWRERLGAGDATNLVARILSTPEAQLG